MLKQYFSSLKNNMFKKVIAILSALAVIVSVIAIPLAIRADDSEKMFVISPNAEGESKYANVFIPLDFRESGGVKFDSSVGDKFYYFKLTFRAVLFNDKMPIIGIMRTDPWGEKWGSFSEPNRAHNGQNDPNITQNDTILTTSYDDATSTFTAIVKMYINDKYSANSTKAHTAITIGNMEHNAGWYSEKNFDAHFAFAYPELYAYDTATGETYGENLIAGINDSTVNLGTTYKHTSNPYTGNDHLLGAPANKWSIEATPSLIALQEIPAGYFDHSFTYHPLVAPTIDTDGTVAYYTCECDICKGKYFSDRGITEITAADLVIPKNPADKMLLIGSNGEESITNIFAPIDLNDSGVMTSGAKNLYVKVSFKARMIKGTQPIVGRVSAYKSGNIQGAKSSTNTAYNNQISSSITGISSEYDPDTMTFTAVIRVRYGASNQTLPNGVHEVITIGNAEHDGSGYSEKDFDVSFYMSQPECYVLDADGNAIGENVFPVLNEYTFDSENVYTHAAASSSSAYTGADSLVFAEKGKWSIDTTAKYISIHDIPEDYFTAGVHEFVEHPAKMPTDTEAGNILYYTCECDHCKDKYFTDYGVTEISEEDIFINKQMIVVSPNSSGGSKIANAFIPLDFRSSGGVEFDSVTTDSYYYFKLSFKAKLLGNGVPIIGLIRYNPYGNLGSWSEPNRTNNNQDDANITQNDEILMSSYDEETMMFTAIVKMWISEKHSSPITGAHSAITIGNAEHNDKYRSEHNFETSFAFYNPTLYAYNTTTGETYGENLISDITTNTVNDSMVYKHPQNDYAGSDSIMRAPANIWSIDGQKSMITFSEIPENYFVPTKGTPHMVIFAGSNDKNNKVGSNGKIYQKLGLEAGKNYKLSYNAKYGNTGIEGDKLGGQLEYLSGGQFKEVTSTKSESDTEYKEIFEFTMPNDADSGNNFKFTFNYSSMFTSGYMANFELYEVDSSGNTIGKNLFKNGDFSVGGIAQWIRSGAAYKFAVKEQIENIFSKTETVKSNMVVYRNTSDYAQIFQLLTLKPSTTYELRYVDLHTDYVSDKKPYNIIYQYYYNDKGSVEDASMTQINKEDLKEDMDPKDVVVISKEGVYTKKVFTTTDKLRVQGENNMLIRFYMRSGSAGFWGPVELYELDENGNRISNNLFLNGDFAFGDTLWNLEGEKTLRIVEMPEKFFENYKDPENMIYSNGTVANQSYSQEVEIDSDKKYYYFGNYVNMNSVGLHPQIEYLTEEGVYKKYDSELFYDADRYYFEIEFNVPEDAKITNGKAKIRVSINNLEKGKGYFTNLMLAESDKYINLLGSTYNSNSNNFVDMDYDSSVFVFYYDDTKFDDGDWSGEKDQNSYEVTIGEITGKVVDKAGNPVAGQKMKLTPGGITVTTNEVGLYEFKNLEPNTYDLYLVENEKSSLYCITVTVKKGITSNIPLITYCLEEGNVGIDEDNDQNEDINNFDDLQDNSNLDIPSLDIDSNETENNDVETAEYGVIRGFYYTKQGKTIEGAEIFLRGVGSCKTDNTGMFMFENVTPGDYELYVLLEDGSEYVLREVTIAPNKGIQVKVMEPILDTANAGVPWIIIGIIAGGVVLLAGATVVVLLLIKKRKKAI